MRTQEMYGPIEEYRRLLPRLPFNQCVAVMNWLYDTYGVETTDAVFGAR